MQVKSTTRTTKQKAVRKEAYRNRSPEQLARDKAANKRCNWTPERVAADSERQRKRRASMSPEKRSHLLKAHRDYHYKTHKLKKYGLTEEAWQALFDGQGRRCKICDTGTPNAAGRWHTDHCHTTKAVRGILCQRCNNMLGLAKDKISTLLQAASYLTESALRNQSN